MSTTFFFYDLETSGFSPREARIMQFAGQRTDTDLNPIGPPYNFLLKMTEDVLPDPDAILVTGITPQKTITDGITEAEFLKIFAEKINTPNTIFVGFNNIRFDDEFMRFLHYRNFYDPYEWHWLNGCSRWDLLDVVRMTRALRPDGIKWPVDSAGTAANRLELLTKINGLKHAAAHDALSDVEASIALAQLLRTKQPKLFDFLVKHRDKKLVAQLVNKNQPFVYTTGKYASEFEKTSVAVRLADHPKHQGALVYDLRIDPMLFLDHSPQKLAEMWRHFCRERPCPHTKLPVKTLQFNRCPAVAPLSVLDKTSQKRLQLFIETIENHLKKLQPVSEKFVDKLYRALEILDKQQQTRLLSDELDVDGRLYDGFVQDADKRLMQKVREADLAALANLQLAFKDDRLTALLPLYKARNFPRELTAEERAIWDRFRDHKLLGGKQESRAAKYFKRLEELAGRPDLTNEQRYVLEELQLYGQSVLPLEAVA